MIAIVDYGMGNLRSVEKALNFAGAETVVSHDPETIDSAPAIVFPGVGAFGDAMSGLKIRGILESVRRRAIEARDGGRPFLGICLGMQTLVEEGEEDPGVPGLGALKGSCPRLKVSDRALKIPHMGWNTLRLNPGDGERLFIGLPEKPFVYFVHSFYVSPAEKSDIAAETEYGSWFCAAVARGNLFATQFHPEKSQAVGLQILKNFIEIAK